MKKIDKINWWKFTRWYYVPKTLHTHNSLDPIMLLFHTKCIPNTFAMDLSMVCGMTRSETLKSKSLFLFLQIWKYTRPKPPKKLLLIGFIQSYYNYDLSWHIKISLECFEQKPFWICLMKEWFVMKSLSMKDGTQLVLNCEIFIG